jgi:hypothetical protein
MKVYILIDHSRQIAEWVADKFGPITKAHEKELEGRKRKHEPTHQLELETQGHTIRVLINGSDVTYVGVRKKTEVGSGNLQDLLRLIMPRSLKEGVVEGYRIGDECLIGYIVGVCWFVKGTNGMPSASVQTPLPLSLGYCDGWSLFDHFWVI